MVALSDFETPLITTGNSEVDKKIGGGLPPNSLTLFEGQPDAGKSVLVQQFVWGCLETNKRVSVYTTENTTVSLLRQMKSLSLDVDDYFLLGQLNVFPVPNSFPEGADSLYTDLLRHIASKPVDVVFVDALTAFASHATERQTLDFFSRAKEVCDSGVSLVVTLHSYATTEQMMTRLSSICDAHLRLRVEDLGTQLVKVIEVSKVRGATKTTGNIVSFDVEPNFGMKNHPDYQGEGMNAVQIKSPELREAVDGAPHLRTYLEKLPDDVEEPEWTAKPQRKSGNAPKNLIYPVGSNCFVHILVDEEDARDTYYAIDPAMAEELTVLMREFERRLLDYVDELEHADTDEEKKDVLLNAVAREVKVSSQGMKVPEKGKPVGDLLATPDQYEALKFLVIRDKLGLGVLEALIRDAYIEDISCSGLGSVFIEHKVYGALKSNIIFTEMEELDSFVLRLSERIKKPVTFRNPISDATLPDGSRINIVYGGDISTRGSNFTIRKFTAVPLSILDIIDGGGISFEMAAYLSLCVQEGMNFFVSGETASGKTTLLNALTCFYEPAAKIVSIEDTPELQVPHPNWTREVVRGSMSDVNAGVGMFALLKAALRQRPNAIIVGEIRGEEGAIAFQAMQTGHACAATFHASSVEKLIQRLTGTPISVPKTYVDNLNVVCIASAVRLPNGRPGRRILSIAELIGYDAADDAFSFMEVYHWNSHNDTFEATGTMNSYIMEHHVAPKRGYAPGDKRGIYAEIDKRARLFERLLKAGRTNFYDLYKAWGQAQRQGII